MKTLLSNCRLLIAIFSFFGVFSTQGSANQPPSKLLPVLPMCPAASQTAWSDCVASASLPGGQRYTGEFRNGRRHGFGEMVSPTGARYVGEFRDGQAEGRGVYIFPSGARYVGEFIAGRRHGEGVFYSANGAVQSAGSWSNDTLAKRYLPDPDLYPFDLHVSLLAQRVSQQPAAHAATESRERSQLDNARPEATRPREQLAYSSGQLPVMASPSNSERRVALVIGNAAYRSNPLENPVNDANDIALALRGLGFQVLLNVDATLSRMREATREFEKMVVGSDVALIFYAGHGIESKGTNFMVPVDADLRRPYELEDTAYNANRWLEMLDATTAKDARRVNIVILDACRDTPLTRGWSTRSVGLAKMDAPTGTILVYSTAPGRVASDGLARQRNSPFTRHLLSTMQVPNQSIEQVLKETRRRVVEETRGEQVPWEHSSLVGDFVFRLQRN
jgi:hypothetical protein